MNIKRYLLVIALIFLIINVSLTISSISVSGNPFFTVNPYSILISIYIVTLLPLFVGILITYYIISNRRKIVNYFKKILRLLSKSDDIEYGKKNIKSFLGAISALIILFALYLLRKRCVENKELDVEKSTATTNQTSFIQIFDVNR